ncbi:MULTISPECIES: fumarylacetoacetate hydrolase family protein [Aerococcus]|nr:MULTISPECIES: fumarylacetoacetate hydrolase family protein [Aerococcus]MDK6369318.1 fumarylacetoacetate hydrolase family protein [Aerococcus sp. UMB9870]MDK6679142.1 fumarylacetoacetate hydrolase family protein [Aerococcus sp. UMB8608]MDK6687173.1 fumarylacetoacetate hydrolase family protein [Aerococcus sp. UMB8623]MDK6941129.1 fumarylacetoacetate hydrolase family protein [Aerococcus sp. UMB8487]OFK13530.1 hypothetical protein HMPREF2829_05745 [Aerococcus sp. HMSC072A12]
MQFFNYLHQGQPALGGHLDGRHYALSQWIFEHDNLLLRSTDDLIQADQSKDLIDRLQRLTSQDLPVLGTDIDFLPAVLAPEKILCVGLNYQDHIDEVDRSDAREEPTIFSKFNNALAACGQGIPFPSYGKQLDYEAELVAIVGEEIKDIQPEDFRPDMIFAYTAGNDLSLRDRQFASSQWLVGKTGDAFAPLGPYITLSDQLDPQGIKISCQVNGQTVQEASTQQMIFSIPEIVSYLSRHMTLKPGDLIFTGTPDGVIAGKTSEDQVWLQVGDQVCVSIEGIGQLENRII